MYEVSLQFPPFVLLNLLEFKMSQSLNVHGMLTFSGTIEQAQMTQYLELAMSETWVTCTASNDFGEEQTLFVGILTDLEIHIEGGVAVLRAVIQTGTYLLEHQSHTRTFQSIDMEYSEIISTCLAHYSNANHMMHVRNRSIDDVIVQYHETDWSFIKRLASHYHTVICPESTISGIKFYFGSPVFRNPVQIEAHQYSVKKDFETYRFQITHDLDVQEKDALVFICEDRQLYKLGTEVELSDRKLYVAQIESSLIGAELVHRHYLRSMAGMQTPKSYNPCIAGISLSGSILDIQKDVVTISVKQDENLTPGTKWFPYSTVYSSPNGAGFYCMPEAGDEIRLYFPSDDEADGYVASATHIGQGGNIRLNPDNKSLLTKYGKQLLFTPTSITMTNNLGMSITLDDNKGISIQSDKKISMHSEDRIEVISGSGTIAVSASEEVILSQGDSAVVISDDVSFSTTEIHMG